MMQDLAGHYEVLGFYSRWSGVPSMHFEQRSNMYNFNSERITLTTVLRIDCRVASIDTEKTNLEAITVIWKKDDGVLYQNGSSGGG